MNGQSHTRKAKLGKGSPYFLIHQSNSSFCSGVCGSAAIEQQISLGGVRPGDVDERLGVGVAQHDHASGVAQLAQRLATASRLVPADGAAEIDQVRVRSRPAGSPP